LEAHDVTPLSFHCDAVVHASCADQWEQTKFPSTVKTTEYSVSDKKCVMRETVSIYMYI